MWGFAFSNPGLLKKLTRLYEESAFGLQVLNAPANSVTWLDAHLIRHPLNLRYKYKISYRGRLDIPSLDKRQKIG
jgi:hypothetical protein